MNLDWNGITINRETNHKQAINETISIKTDLKCFYNELGIFEKLRA